MKLNERQLERLDDVEQAAKCLEPWLAKEAQRAEIDGEETDTDGAIVLTASQAFAMLNIIQFVRTLHVEWKRK